VSVVLLSSHDGGVAAHLPGDVLVDQALTGVRAAAGLAVPVTAAASSLAWAAETLALRAGRR
jgi:hypothetical protein